jgi:hypothetical protein
MHRLPQQFLLKVINSFDHSLTGHITGQVSGMAGEQHKDYIKENLMNQLIKYTELRSLMPETGRAAIEFT